QVRPPEVGRPAQPVRVGLAPQLTRHRVVLRGDGRLTTIGATATPRAPDHHGRALAALSAPTLPAHHPATRSAGSGRRPSRRTPASRPPACTAPRPARRTPGHGSTRRYARAGPRPRRAGRSRQGEQPYGQPAGTGGWAHAGMRRTRE